MDFRSPHLEARLDYFSEFKKLAGFRHVVQGEADPNFILRDPFCQGIGLLEKYNFSYDILIFPHQLGATLEFVKRFPNQRFVIDHLAKPYIKDGFFDGWAVLMRELAKMENVSCKISG
ncbi:MAG: amidohydrolase family protein, partial [Bacteroidota bacterium]